MERRPKAPEVEEVLAGLDQSWQELVKLLKEERGRPTPQGAGAQEPVAPGAVPKEDGAPSPDIDRVRQWISPGPEALSTEAPQEPAQAPMPEPDRQKSPPRGWGQKLFNIATLLLLAVSLAGLSFLLAQSHRSRGQVDTGSLAIRGQDGVVRAWLGERDGLVSLCLLDKAGRSRAQMTLDADGSPSLTLLDELQKHRVELRLGPGGEPQFNLVKEPEGPAVPGPKASAPSESPGSPEAVRGPAAAPPAQSQPPALTQAEEAGTKAPAAAAIGKFVGSKTSNKYHYPECRWAKKIKPERLLNFGSVEEAREKGYIPCPACRPPAH